MLPTKFLALILPQKNFLSSFLKNIAAKLRIRLDSSHSHCLKKSQKKDIQTFQPFLARKFKYYKTLQTEIKTF